jgi:hypothetical protein
MKMKRIVAFCFVVLLVSFLAGCTGYVNLAKTQPESLKASYPDPQLAALNQKYSGLLKEIYARYNAKGIGVAKEGLGFVTVRDSMGGKVAYLFVETHHEECNFDKNSSTGQERLQTVMQKYFEPELKVLTKNDLPSDVSGLAFGVAWAVRDFYQCDQYGGIVEYVVAYMDRSDFYAVLDGTKTLKSVLVSEEVLASLDSQPATPVKMK